MKSTKAFAVDVIGGVTKVRVLMPPDSPKYNSDIHFMWFEESDYLVEELHGIPYATFHTDDRDLMEYTLQNGYTDPEDRVTWMPFFGYWKDQEGTAYLAPEKAGIKDLRDVGVFTSMASPADFMKIGKYTNRLFASLLKPEHGGTEPVRGLEIEWNEQESYSLVQIQPHSDLTEEDSLLSVRYVDLKSLNAEQKALVDGCILINEKAVRALRLSNDPRIGMAWRGTFGTQRGLGKGHILYVPHLTHDVVIYGPKTILKTGKFFFGAMDRLHVGIPHTDRQAFVNFGFHREGLATDLARAYMRKVVAASKNEHLLRSLLIKYTKNSDPSKMDRDEWILTQALRYGVSFLRFPGLFRRVVRYFAGPNSPVFQCDNRARIPMDDIAQYGYVLPDINAIDEEGDIHPEKAIPAGTIVFPDLPAGTKVVCYRQPSENSNAWVALTVVHRPEYKRFAGKGICLLGRGADKVLGRLGGGDMDDQFVIVHDPKWVEAFHTMRPYPETNKISADPDEDELGSYQQTMSELEQFTDELMEDITSKATHYTIKHISWQIDMATAARAGIGPVVNFGIQDMLMSDPDHKASMLADLSDKQEAWEWLEEREPWQAALYMTNLELIIDGNVKDQTLLAKLGDVAGAIREFHKDCMVYPKSQADRIPISKLEAADYVLARSLTCKCLDVIRAYREKLMEIFGEREYALASAADEDLRTEYPREREIVVRVRGDWKRVDGEWTRVDDNVSIMDIWATEWMEEMSSDRSHEGAYDRIVKIIARELEDEDNDMMERLAVEIYYQTYKRVDNVPRYDETTGRIRGFNDGLLWCPVFSTHFINALRNARLAGYYAKAEIRPEFIGRLANSSVVVEVRSHNVYIQDSEDQFTVWVGFVYGKCPDYRYRMDSGMIEVRRPKDICLPQDLFAVQQRPLTRINPSAKLKQAEDLVKESEGKETRGFKAMMNKAIEILGLKGK